MKLNIHTAHECDQFLAILHGLKKKQALNNDDLHFLYTHSEEQPRFLLPGKKEKILQALQDTLRQNMDRYLIETYQQYLHLTEKTSEREKGPMPEKEDRFTQAKRKERGEKLFDLQKHHFEENLLHAVDRQSLLRFYILNTTRFLERYSMLGRKVIDVAHLDIEGMYLGQLDLRKVQFGETSVKEIDIRGATLDATQWIHVKTLNRALIDPQKRIEIQQKRDAFIPWT